jgi:hypothetical protein
MYFPLMAARHAKKAVETAEALPATGTRIRRPWVPVGRASTRLAWVGAG